MERRLTRLSDVGEKKSTYLWQDRIRLGDINILGGDPGGGKSTLTYDLIARTTTGRPMPFCESALPAAGAVLLQAEDHLQSVIMPNLRAAGADLGKILVLDKSKFQERPLLLPEDIPLLDEALKEIEGSLLVLDPIPSFLPGSANSEQSVRHSLGALAALAERRNVAVLLVRHQRKSGGRNALYRGAGSIAFTALARSELVVVPDPDSDDRHRHVLALAKSNLAVADSLIFRTIRSADGTITIEWIGTSPRNVDDLAHAVLGSDQQLQIQEAMYFLVSAFSRCEPIPVLDLFKLARLAGISITTLKRAKRALHMKSRRVGGGIGSKWYWLPPDDERLLQQFRDRDLDELVNDLCHGHPLLNLHDVSPSKTGDAPSIPDSDVPPFLKDEVHHFLEMNGSLARESQTGVMMTTTRTTRMSDRISTETR